MQVSVKVKLCPDKEQYQSLLRTMERFNEACNFISEISWANHTTSVVKIHHLCYHDIRKQFGLSAQMAVRAVGKVSDSYKTDNEHKHSFKPHGAMVYDQRIMSWKGLQKVSLLTFDGRQVIPIILGGYQSARLEFQRRGQADLILINGIFYLVVIVDVPEQPEIVATEFLGIDLGIVNIAADSDGAIYSGAQINGLRKRHSKFRKKLQSKGTKSAKKLLKKRSRKEHNFATNTNHCIAKSIVAKAKDTGRGIAIEDLGGIRTRTTVRKAQRKQHNSWAFAQLRMFIEYKAKIAGITVKAVNPRNTSRTCPQCGCIDKHNRPSQSIFCCVSCGFSSAVADTIAAGNISRRASVNVPHVSPDLIGVREGTSSLALAVSG